MEEDFDFSELDLESFDDEDFDEVISFLPFPSPSSR